MEQFRQKAPLFSSVYVIIVNCDEILILVEMFLVKKTKNLMNETHCWAKRKKGKDVP